MGSTLDEFINFILDIDDFPLRKSFRKKFIQDFLSAIVCEDEFVIRLDRVALWLGVLEGHLKETLTRSYKEDEDYIVKKTKSTGGRPKENVFLTSDCFKRLCMRSQAKNAEQIRSYFIEIEKLYREHLLNGIADRRRREDEAVTEKKLQTPRTRLRVPPGPCVYVIKVTLGNKKVVYKLGRTIDLQRRWSEHQRLLPGKIQLVYFVMFAKNEWLEVCVQNLLQQRQVNKLELTEIYETELDEIKTTLESCKDGIDHTLKTQQRNLARKGRKQK